jgi:hypothetical protein
LKNPVRTHLAMAFESNEFLVEYKAKDESAKLAVYALGHVTDRLGKKLVVEFTPTAVKRYQRDRLAEKAGPKTINDEMLLLLRFCGDQGDLIRAKLRREKAMKLEAHAAWYIRRFGECKPEWYVFPAGKGQLNDPTRPVTTLRTAWRKVRDKAKVVGRWHDNRHSLVTELGESLRATR